MAGPETPETGEPGRSARDAGKDSTKAGAARASGRRRRAVPDTGTDTGTDTGSGSASTPEPLLARVFERDGFHHCLRLDPAGLTAPVTVTATLAGHPLPVTEATGRLVMALPEGATPADTLQLGLATGGRALHWQGPLSALRDATPPRLAAAPAQHDPLRGHLRIGGWCAGLPRASRIVLSAGGREIAATTATEPRPDLIRRRGLLPRNAGFTLRAALSDPALAQTLELRALDRLGRVLAVLPVALPDLSPDPPLLSRLAARAAAMPRARLDRLIASDPFRRRWQQEAPEGQPAHPCLIAREAVAAELAARLRPGEEIAVRLTDGDRVLCRPVDDAILARRYLIEAGDEIGFLRWLSAQIRPGDTAIDAGGAYGVMSRTMARAGARVITVEADPLAADRIRRAGLDHPPGRIELVEAALSDAPGEVVFAGMGAGTVGSGKILGDDAPGTVAAFLDEVSGLTMVPLSLLHHDAKERRTFGPGDVAVRRVPAVTFDGICAERGLRDVAMVKMDIEGGELMALRGAQGLLDGAFGRPPVVAFEYSALFPMRGGRREEILDMFLTRGWSLWRLAGGKGRGGEPVAVENAAAAPRHDNLIAVPPGRQLRPVP